MEEVVFVLLNLSVLIIVMCLLILWAVWQSRSRGRANRAQAQHGA